MNIQRGTNIHVVSSTKNQNTGYLKIFYRKGNKTIVKSLGIKVLKKDFNDKTQRMRLNTFESEKRNEYIESQIKNLSFAPYTKSKTTSICDYMEIVINRTNQKSTKQKYNNIQKLFKEFVELNYNKDDLYFYEIDSNVIFQFRNYLLTKKLRNTNNTVNYKLKSFKSFFSKLEKEQIYHYQISPFVNLQMKYDESKKSYLNLVEFKALIKTDFIDTRKRKDIITYSINDIKNSFIFSTLAQGLRISDILTLRWNDFSFSNEDFDIHENLQIIKKQIKTKKIVNVYIDLFVVYFLYDNIIRCSNTIHENDIEYNNKINVLNNRLSQKKELQNIIDDNKINDKNLNRLNTQLHNKNLKEIVQVVKKISDKIENNKETERYKEELKQNETELFNLNEIIFNTLYNLVKNLAQNINTKSMFVFSFLSDDDFKDIDERNDFSRISDKQFLEFQGRRSYINKLLKENIFNQLNTNKDLSFHSGRHTYTSLIKDTDINIYDIMKSLGHTNITSTEKYLHGFNSKKLININNSLTNSLNNI